jgi:hypothetical protein
MSGNTNNSPMLKAAGLWAKSSVKGGQYLTGRLGGVKVLVMENRDRKSDDDPSHTLFFVEAPDRRQERGDGVRAPTPPQTNQRPSEDRRRIQTQAPLDHDDAPEWAR